MEVMDLSHDRCLMVQVADLQYLKQTQQWTLVIRRCLMVQVIDLSHHRCLLVQVTDLKQTQQWTLVITDV